MFENCFFSEMSSSERGISFVMEPTENSEILLIYQNWISSLRNTCKAFNMTFLLIQLKTITPESGTFALNSGLLLKSLAMADSNEDFGTDG
ncbi:hypothetical protein NPIL_133731 [Nephila pilipes]|uniref:Uncharacterized protein n=1 Tax=Nephila pilipes TaxID=299642 RepID=A0A8X6QQ91_NEPPI|nr:hypothetical protein NPIL_133731 [Nephila pilipes]